MALPTASDNVFPKVIISEAAAPASPSAGQFKLYVDSSDHILKYKNSSGTVTPLGQGVADGGTIGTYLDFTTGAAPSSPAAGKIRIYSKTGDHMYQKDSGGTETALDAAGSGSSIPDQSIAYPTSASGDDDLCTSTAGWSDVGADAFTTFSSDGHRILLVINGASKSSTIRKTLGTTKAAAFDFRFGIMPHVDYFSASDDTYLAVFLKTSGGTQIAGFRYGPNTSRFIDLAAAGSGAFTQSHSVITHHTPTTLRITRDGSDVCRFYLSMGSTPFDLAQLRQPNTGTYLAPLTFTSSGTVARVEINVVTAASHSASAINGGYIDFFQSA